MSFLQQINTFSKVQFPSILMRKWIWLYLCFQQELAFIVHMVPENLLSAALFSVLSSTYIVTIKSECSSFDPGHMATAAAEPLWTEAVLLCSHQGHWLAACVSRMYDYQRVPASLSPLPPLGPSLAKRSRSSSYSAGHRRSRDKTHSKSSRAHSSNASAAKCE